MLRKDPAERPPNLVTAVRALEDAALSPGISIPAGPAPSGVYNASTSAIGAPAHAVGGDAVAQQRGRFGQRRHGDPPPTRSAIPATCLIPPIPRGKGWIIALAVIGAIVVGVAVFLVVRSTRAADPSAAPPARVASGSARVRVGAAAGAGGGRGLGPTGGLGRRRPRRHRRCGPRPGPASDPPAGPGPAARLGPRGLGRHPGSGAAARTAPATVEIDGPLSGTRVYGLGGKLPGASCWLVQLARADADVVVTLKADGYVTGRRQCTLAADRSPWRSCSREGRALITDVPHRRQPEDVNHWSGGGGRRSRIDWPMRRWCACVRRLARPARGVGELCLRPRRRLRRPWPWRPGPAAVASPGRLRHARAELISVRRSRHAPLRHLRDRNCDLACSLRS